MDAFSALKGFAVSMCRATRLANKMQKAAEMAATTNEESVLFSIKVWLVPYTKSIIGK